MEEIPTKDKVKRCRQGDPADSNTGLTSVKKEERRLPPPKAPLASLHPTILDWGSEFWHKLIIFMS